MMWRVDEGLAKINTALESADTPGGPLCQDDLLALDDREEFPGDAARFLDKIGTPYLYTDHGDGGILGSLFTLTSLVRLLARKDVTLAVGHAKTFLGAVCVWLAGHSDQREWLAAEILNGAVVSWALSERGHGGDLLACSVHAKPSEVSWTLSGEKWLINNATRGQLVCVLARTRPHGGPRGFSLFLFDKRRVDPGTWKSLPKVPTHGVRGADISGIAFEAARLSPDTLVGEAGAGFEITLKALQLTRTVCCGLSLGALDHALALGTVFVSRRMLYGKRLAEVPEIRRELGQALATLHAAEAVTFAAARLAATAPEEMTVVSSIVKALVPTLCQQAITSLGEMLGLRSFLSADEPYRAFQKLDRDHRIVSIFDGSTAVCESQLIQHFPVLASVVPSNASHEPLLQLPAQRPDASQLNLRSRQCSLVTRFGADCDLIASQAAAGHLPNRTAASAFAVRNSLHATCARMGEVTWEPHKIPQEAFDIARDFELCFAAAAACHLWAHCPREPGDGGALWASGLWLSGVLALIQNKLPHRPSDSLAHEDAFDSLAELALASRGTPVPALFGSGMAPV